MEKNYIVSIVILLGLFAPSTSLFSMTCAGFFNSRQMVVYKGKGNINFEEILEELSVVEQLVVENILKNKELSSFDESTIFNYYSMKKEELKNKNLNSQRITNEDKLNIDRVANELVVSNLRQALPMILKYRNTKFNLNLLIKISRQHLLLGIESYGSSEKDKLMSLSAYLKNELELHLIALLAPFLEFEAGLNEIDKVVDELNEKLLKSIEEEERRK